MEKYKFIRTMRLTPSQARHLAHMGFIVKFVTYTINGLLFEIGAKEVNRG